MDDYIVPSLAWLGLYTRANIPAHKHTGNGKTLTSGLEKHYLSKKEAIGNICTLQMACS